jgi:hypothetical protein
LRRRAAALARARRRRSTDEPSATGGQAPRRSRKEPPLGSMAWSQSTSPGRQLPFSSTVAAQAGGGARLPRSRSTPRRRPPTTGASANRGRRPPPAPEARSPSTSLGRQPPLPLWSSFKPREELASPWKEKLCLRHRWCSGHLGLAPMVRRCRHEGMPTHARIDCAAPSSLRVRGRD